ncbi:MAG TPA: class E sortase [Mycobacteriales bacterium]|nr:class E sortase [Mycobacteriales bacterium]
MTFTMDRDPRPHARHAKPDPWGDRLRTGVRGTGQTLITAGLVILLFVVYELWITNIFNAHTQHQLHAKLEQQWSQGKDPLAVGPARPGTKLRDIPLGDGVALIRIPAFGADWAYTIVEGTGERELAEGPGHYTGTALPGEVGDFAVAGHRVGKGSPFLNLDKLRAGDFIVVETKDYWYAYRVLGDQASGDPTQVDQDGIPGQEIVQPTDIDVIDPVPGHPGRTPNRRMITLTTCNPRFSAAQRMIIHGEMVGAPLKKGPGVVPPALQNS